MANRDEVRNFIKDIKIEDKIALVFHDDLDGFASGILMYDYLIKMGCKDIQTVSLKIETNAFENIVEDLKKSEKIIIMDLGPNLLVNGLQNLKDKKILYIDHHQNDVEIPDNVLEYRTEGLIPATRSVYDFVDGKLWLAVAGIISDAGFKNPDNMKIINSFLDENSISFNDFKEDVVEIIDSFLIYFREERKKAFEILKDVNDWKELGEIKKFAEPIIEETEKFVKDYEENHEKLGKIKFYYFKPKFKVKVPVTNKIGYKYPDEIFVFASPSGGMVSLSARNQGGQANMIEVLKAGIEGLEDAGCGGHIPAAGGQIKRSDLDKFKDNLKNWGDEG